MMTDSDVVDGPEQSKQKGAVDPQIQPDNGDPQAGSDSKPVVDATVTTQPGGRTLAPILGCPPGLECLTQLDQLLVRQEINLQEVLTGWECKNRFKVLNNMGEQVFYAMEESTIFQRLYCNRARGFVYHIIDTNMKEVLRVRRTFQCGTGWYCFMCKSCRYYATVEDSKGDVLGYVSNLQFCCSPHFGIFDDQKNLIAAVRGSCCPCQAACCTEDIDLNVTAKEGAVLGKISKQWLGLIPEILSDSDNFHISFPVTTDVKMKALMLGAVFIIDMMMFEKPQNK